MFNSCTVTQGKRLKSMGELILTKNKVQIIYMPIKQKKSYLNLIRIVFESHSNCI
jgi:hypothetical protein